MTEPCSECGGANPETTISAVTEDGDEVLVHIHDRCNELMESACKWNREHGLCPAPEDGPTYGRLVEWTRETMREEIVDGSPPDYWPIDLAVTREALEAYATDPASEIERLRRLMEEGGRIAERLKR